ncbi:hypothetical protein E3N88_23172 [Mikania micrantha]|uniref:Uncharacterized protein n=1 Tax=Mikania micrantha TaxID=192012 RepID=A0A5N6NCJ1_9ASTR|nr:hypothetical protein E3N88_23172 [Mikania micrantha]
MVRVEVARALKVAFLTTYMEGIPYNPRAAQFFSTTSTAKEIIAVAQDGPTIQHPLQNCKFALKKEQTEFVLLLALEVVDAFTGAFVVIGYVFKGSGESGDYKAFSKINGDFSCTYDVHKSIPILKKTYGDSMQKVLHIGPDTCSIVSQLRKEKDTET